MIAQTSLLAFEEITKLSLIGKKQAAVYEAIKRLGRPSTAMEISDFLHWSINRVTPRIFELRHQGLIIQYGVRCCGVTGKKAYTNWVVEI